MQSIVQKFNEIDDTEFNYAVQLNIDGFLPGPMNVNVEQIYFIYNMINLTKLLVYVSDEQIINVN